MDRNDPVYLCGKYEAKLSALRVIIEAADKYLSPSDITLMRAILGIPVSDPALAARLPIERFYDYVDHPVPAALSTEEPF